MESAFSPVPERPTLIVVLGMHRSGTSVTTRAMEALGANLGDNLMPPAAGINPKGFFEDLDVATLDRELMDAAGVDWHALPDVDLARLSEVELDHFTNRALTLLREKCRSGLFAMKDPRIPRLLPFWQRVFERLDVRVLNVIAFRNPVSVARSLAVRDELPYAKSYLLWLAHVVSALEHTENQARTLVNYDALVEAPGTELTRLAADLDLTLDAAACETFEREFLDGDLRHTRFSGADLETAEGLPPVAKELFKALEAAVNAPTRATEVRLAQAQSEARAFLANAAPLMARDWEYERQLKQAHNRIAELEHALADAHANLAASQQRCAALEQSEHALQASIESLEGRLRDTEQAAGEQRREFEQTIAKLNADVSALLNSSSWRLTAPLRAARRRFSR